MKFLEMMMICVIYGVGVLKMMLWRKYGGYNGFCYKFRNQLMEPVIELLLLSPKFMEDKYMNYFIINYGE